MPSPSSQSETNGSSPPVLLEGDAPIEMESLCMRCYENGTTRLLATRIPFYKQVLLMSFTCPHCGWRNSELQSGEPCQEHGVEITLRVHDHADLNRLVVKSEYAGVEIPEVELVVPPRSQPGEITTVEGVLERVMNGLEQDQPQRREIDEAQAVKIDEFLAKLGALRELNSYTTPWTLKLRDPSGNSFIQNPHPGQADPHCIIARFPRSLDDNKLLGLVADEVEAAPMPSGAENDEISTGEKYTTEKDQESERSGERVDGAEAFTTTSEEWKSYDDCKGEVLHFPGTCQSCGARVETLMKSTDIPHFQTVIIMATNCDHCGSKYNEVKAGGETKAMGCRLTLRIEEPVDLARDVLKSDTCSLCIPQLQLEVGGGALPSRFTTVEGLLQAVRDQLEEQSHFLFGDSATAAGDNAGEERGKFESLLHRLDDIIALREKGTKLVLDDPAGNSYIMSLTAPLDDDRLEKCFYERNYEQNEELGLNDMCVEGYAPPASGSGNKGGGKKHRSEHRDGTEAVKRLHTISEERTT